MGEHFGQEFPVVADLSLDLVEVVGDYLILAILILFPPFSENGNQSIDDLVPPSNHLVHALFALEFVPNAESHHLGISLGLEKSRQLFEGFDQS